MCLVAAKQDEVEADEFEVVAEEKTDREYYEEEVGEKPEPGTRLQSSPSSRLLVFMSHQGPYACSTNSLPIARGNILWPIV